MNINLPTGEWVSLLKGAGVAAIGALLTYAAQNVGQMDFGQSTPLVAAALAVVVNFIRKSVMPAEVAPIEAKVN